MLNEVQKARLAVRFSQLDSNGNGFIEEDDMKLMADKACKKLLNDEKHTALRAEVHEAYRALWQKLEAAADTNGDHKISKEEFAEAWGDKLLNDQAAYQRSVQRILTALFKALDTDEDGTVDRATFDNIYKTFGWSSEELNTIAGSRDKFDLKSIHDAARQFHMGKAQPSAA